MSDLSTIHIASSEGLFLRRVDQLQGVHKFFVINHLKKVKETCSGYQKVLGHIQFGQEHNEKTETSEDD